MDKPASTALFPAHREPAHGAREQEALVRALRNPALYPHAADRVELIETHISYVLLAGTYAYKVKKAVDLEFLDFSSLSARHFYCTEELRLNRRLAPELYLDVLPIAGSPEHPVIGGDGVPIEYAVRMRRFSQDALLDRVLARAELTPAHIDQLARKIAAFHAASAVANVAQPFGNPAVICKPVLENVGQLEPLLDAASDRAELSAYRAWLAAQHARLENVFTERKRDGFVRECHGDLHLGNIALIDGAITIFDCLEFNRYLSWIDVINEIAFPVMDLQAAERPDLARRLLNAYLEETGDYAGLRVLDYYRAYRAMVRAKIIALRAREPAQSDEGRAALAERCGRYVRLARSYAEPGRPAIVITHGFSGSGKTTHSQSLFGLAGAVRIRSDVERKRMHGVAPHIRVSPGVASGLYAADAVARTYTRLAELAQIIADTGRIAIVDAAFLHRWQRHMFRALAERKGIPFAIVDFPADAQVLRERISQRTARGGDASDADRAVLDHQLTTHDPFAPDELEFVVAYESFGSDEPARQVPGLEQLLQRG